VVSPHPDDGGGWGAGGLIHTWKSLGRSVTVISVTDGEAGPNRQWRRASHRYGARNSKDALQVLCDNPVLVVRLGIPDGLRGPDYGNKLRSAVFFICWNPGEPP